MTDSEDWVQYAAARGAPRHDQRRIVWGVYDETTRRGVNTYPACIRIHVLLYSCTYSTVVHVYRRGRSKRRSSSAFQNRTSAHPDKKTRRQTDRQTDTHISLQEETFVLVLRYDSRNMGKMSVLFDLELRMAISAQGRYEGTGVCAMRRRIKVLA